MKEGVVCWFLIVVTEFGEVWNGEGGDNGRDGINFVVHDRIGVVFGVEWNG